MSVQELICQAGRQRRIVKLKLKASKGDAPAESVEFEPYSTRELGGKVSFFCLDIATCACLNVDLTSILDAEITSRSFKPRFPISF